MSQSRIVPVLLAGGSGTRLWPVSRDSMPKQFIPLFGEFSTYQQALHRVSDASVFAPPIVMTSEECRFFAARQADALGIQPTIVIEPARRDSGPAIAAAATIARNRDADAKVLVIAADHVILDLDLFIKTCLAGREAASAGRIVVFGIPPSEPKTSYGYIRRGGAIAGEGAFAVDAFVEKPDLRNAGNYVADGYLWNSGNFLFRTDTLLDELAKFEPEMMKAVSESVAKAAADIGFTRLDREAFLRAPQKSIDFALMERTDRAAVVEGRFRWSDIGSWDALSAVSDVDAQGNVMRGPVVALDVKNCLIHAEERLTAVVGVENLIVVTTPDAVLVIPRERAEDVKRLVAELKRQGRAEAGEHRRTHRPWGYYESIDRGDRFQVKRIVVHPGGALSLQKHLHRAEHWVVVRGTAEVTIENEKRFVQENESTYIPIGAVHRLANPGKIALELVEVQTGSYLGEDDIVRLEDIYARK